ncbi:phosphotransferase [Brevibacillus choshinensis]|uniref:phosphotransferase family protein n=1 Tax=Brevibacillus choshinensis TaxID=54911 RepID=UPI002E1AB341|nr:phosphotransferase [Brevibacillus choshinensis]
MMELLPGNTLITFIKTKYPELSRELIRINDSGWSNLVLMVGEQFIFRFPRTENAKKVLKMEQRILPGLSHFLPLFVPNFVYSSGPGDGIIHVGYPIIKGIPLQKEVLNSFTDKRREQLAQELGGFLTALHTYPIENAFSYAFDASGTRSTWQGIYDRIKKNAFPYMDPTLKGWTDRVFTGFLSDSDSFKFSPCLLHNDFKPEHILYDPEQKKLSGVIDFGSMWVGDPAYDFVGLHKAYGEEFAKKVIRSYGATVDHAFFKRINDFYLKVTSFWKLFHGIETRNQDMIQVALKKLQMIAQKDIR